MAVVAGSAGCAALASSVWVGGCVDRSAARARCLIVFWCEGAWSKSCWVFVWSRSCHALVQCFIVLAEAGSLVFGIATRGEISKCCACRQPPCRVAMFAGQRDRVVKVMD